MLNNQNFYLASTQPHLSHSAQTDFNDDGWTKITWLAHILTNLGTSISMWKITRQMFGKEASQYNYVQQLLFLSTPFRDLGFTLLVTYGMA